MGGGLLRFVHLCITKAVLALKLKCPGRFNFCQPLVLIFVCLFIAVDEAAPYGVSEQTGLPRLLKTKPQDGSLKATDGGGQGPRRFPITASGGTIGGASP